MTVNSKMTAIANAIRFLLGTSGTYTLETMAAAISGITKKTAQTYTPTTADQTIASGQYLSGAQTVKGDENLIASNIKSGKSIFGVTGNLIPGITPSGNKAITSNGTFDVTDYESVSVNVQAGLTNVKQWMVTVTSRIVGTTASIDLIDSDTDLAAHRADISMMVVIEPVSVNYTSGVANVNSAMVGNKEISGASAFYGVSCRRNTNGTAGVQGIAAALTNNGGGVGRIYIDPNGKLNWQSASNTFGIDAGTYRITAWW